MTSTSTFLIYSLFTITEITSHKQLSDKICSFNSSSIFCSDIRKEGLDVRRVPRTVRTNITRLIRDNKEVLRVIREKEDDPSCGSLKAEYDQVCFTPPPPQALAETKAFCDAFVETCSNTLKTNLFTNLSEIQVDYTVYCKREKERFLFVCPKPLRFNTYAEQAVGFCIRYKDRCPNVKLPNEPIPYKDKNDDHIYTREIETQCSKVYRTMRSYCKYPDLLKLPKYALPCAIYKQNCIDVFTRVIYG